MKIIKVANVTKIYGGNPSQGYAKFNTEIGSKLPYVYLMAYVQCF